MNLPVTLTLTADQYQGLLNATELHNASLAEQATEENPAVVATPADYVQFVMSNACQSYFNNIPK